MKMDRKVFTGNWPAAMVVIIAAALFFIPIKSMAQNVEPMRDNASVLLPPSLASQRDSNSVKEMFFAALSKKATEDNKDAAELFGKILQRDPSNDASMYELAKLFKLKNNYADAQALLEKVVTLKPDNEWYWASLADVYERGSELTKLENVFAQLKRINPKKPDYFFDSANTFYLEGKYDDALKDYSAIEKITGPTDELVLARQKNLPEAKQARPGRCQPGRKNSIRPKPGEILSGIGRNV